MKTYADTSFLVRIYLIDLLHTGVALAFGAKEFLTFDTRQADLAKAAGLKVKP